MLDYTIYQIRWPFDAKHFFTLHVIHSIVIFLLHVLLLLKIRNRFFG